MVVERMDEVGQVLDNLHFLAHPPWVTRGTMCVLHLSSDLILCIIGASHNLLFVLTEGKLL